MHKPLTQKFIALVLIVLCLTLIPVLMLANKWFFDDPSSYGIKGGNQDLLSFNWIDVDARQHSFPEQGLGSTYLFLGYLACSDICSLRVQQMASLVKKIEADQQLSSSNINFLFVSIDPENDTPDLRRQVIDLRSPRFTSAVLPDKQLEKLNQQLSQKINRELKTINHAGSLFLVSPQGKVERIYTARQLSSDKMLVDLKHYLEDKTWG